MEPIETIETLEKVILNTSPKQKQANQCVKWCFTYNNYTLESIETLEAKFKNICKKYVFQEEKGENGTPHLQGFILLKNPMRWSEFKLDSSIHWEICRSVEDSIKYCSKEETRNGKIYSMGIIIKKEINILKDLRPWQKEIENKIINTEPDGRTLNWYWESVGNVGKSSFCKYMYVKHQVITIQGGKLADIMNIIFNLDMDNTKAIIIDVPRKNGNKVSYGAIECILNGMITNTKFETGVKVFNPPHLFVFANVPPEQDEDILSADRWNIVEIDNNASLRQTGTDSEVQAVGVFGPSFSSSAPPRGVIDNNNAVAAVPVKSKNILELINENDLKICDWIRLKK